jgi:hypothetical protein
MTQSDNTFLKKLSSIIFRYILSPVLVLIIFSIISQFTTGDFSILFTFITLPTWIILGLLVIIYILGVKLVRLQYKIRPVVKENAYWFPNKNGTEDGPFCTNCYDDHKKRIRIIPYTVQYKKCPKCKTLFEIGNFNKRKQKVSRITKFLNEP